MTAIFMFFSRNGKRSRKRKTEITGKYGRKALVDEPCCILHFGLIMQWGKCYLLGAGSVVGR